MLIELEELKHKINNSKYYGTDAWRDILDMAVDCDSKSRPKGEWIEYESDADKYDDIRCSCCQRLFTVDSYHFTDIGFTKDDLKFCPNCGAYMRGEDNE